MSIKFPIKDIARMIEKIRTQALNGALMHAALLRIKNNGVHHQQCIVDNCRPACPIRIARSVIEP